VGFAALLLGGIVLSAAAVSVTAAQVAVAQSAAGIGVEGNRRVEADTIRSYFKPGPGGRLDAAAIDEGLKGLYATGLFQDVQIRHAGGRLIVSVIENPVINRVQFEGNKSVKDEQIKEEVQSKPRGTLSRPVVQADTQRLIEIYRRSGRFDVTVVPKIIELANNRVDLVFEISEGPKTGIKSIVFAGNRAISDYRLKEVIKTDETGLLSFLKNNDTYDPDRVEADRDLLRRFYLNRGFADIRIVSAVGEYDPAKKGFVVTYTIDEGAQYRFGTVDILSNVSSLSPDRLSGVLKVKSGAVYSADFVEKSVENLTVELSKAGYPFASVRPRGERNFEQHLVNVAFVIEEGNRAYIERINIHGNTRTRDYVIRREFDIAEGDAYNRALVDRAERRLKNLNYFKSVKFTNEPGSAPDRIVINVEVEEKPTGEFSVAGGYSTSDGLLGEVSVSERNLLGRGQFAQASVSYGSKSKGFEVSFVEPYFMGYRLAAGFDIFGKNTVASNGISYDSSSQGFGLSAAFGLREDLSLRLRYSLARQEITLPDNLNNCSLTNPPPGCYSDGEASLAARLELAQGPVNISAFTYQLAYNTLDNNRLPTSGLYAEFKQEVAGLGGDVNYLKTSVDARYYYEVIPDLQSVWRIQAGHVTGWGDKGLRMLDHYQMGPNLVRGFAASGIGPRNLTNGTSSDALGGTLYWGATVELQFPLYFLPKDAGLRAAVFADAGSLWGYDGPIFNPATGETLLVGDSNSVRTSIGAGVIWDSPFGPLRVDFAVPLTKESFDKVQQFRLSGGTKF
jgi:outer membrane protein insertion porin family